MIKEHWAPAASRGSTRSRPPYPQPIGSNDLSARMARVETNAWHEAENTQRVEDESLRRAYDIAQTLDDHEQRITTLEQHLATVLTVIRYLLPLLKWTAAILLFFLAFTLRNVDGMQFILKAFGFGGG